MTDHVMLDIETWGTKADAVMISLGACIFDPASEEISDRFHVAIDPDSGVALGRSMDVSTMLWWMSPERDEARKNWLDQPKVDLYTALEGFRQWCPDTCIWGNGSDFDNAILSSCYRSVGLDQPWRFWNNRCYRTLKSAAPAITIERSGTYHNALDDAISQARHMQKIVAHLGLTL